jgi:hypothetical protein
MELEKDGSLPLLDTKLIRGRWDSWCDCLQKTNAHRQVPALQFPVGHRPVIQRGQSSGVSVFDSSSQECHSMEGEPPHRTVIFLSYLLSHTSLIPRLEGPGYEATPIQEPDDESSQEKEHLQSSHKTYVSCVSEWIRRPVRSLTWGLSLNQAQLSTHCSPKVKDPP